MDCQQTSKSIIKLNEFYDCEAMWKVLMKRVIIFQFLRSMLQTFLWKKSARPTEIEKML